MAIMKKSTNNKYCRGCGEKGALLQCWWECKLVPLLWRIACTCVLSCFSRVQLFATPWTVAGQAPPSMGFSRQEYWSGLQFPSPGDLPDPGIEPASATSPALAGRFFTTSAPWEAWRTVWRLLKKTKNRATIWPCNPTPGHISREKHDLKGFMHPNVHYCNVYNSEDMQATYMSMDGWMVKMMCYKCTMEYYSAIKKEWNNVIFSNMNGPRDCHAEWSRQRRINIIWHPLYVESKKKW